MAFSFKSIHFQDKITFYFPTLTCIHCLIATDKNVNKPIKKKYKLLSVCIVEWYNWTNERTNEWRLIKTDFRASQFDILWQSISVLMTLKITEFFMRLLVVNLISNNDNNVDDNSNQPHTRKREREKPNWHPFGYQSSWAIKQ